jgi:ribosomal protein S18 acetylase RimI-like enzyme
MIRAAKITDIPNILSITKACAAHMENQEIFQWNEHYPSKRAFENDVARNELFVLEKNNAVVGCVVISTFMDDEYVAVKWLTPNQNNIYIHRLAVHPDYQGKGYAQELISYAETFAKQQNIASIRLDTFSKNARNQKFYELRGYKRLGDIYFPKQSKHPFYCYELVL